jgi:hypothetical protein
MQMPSMSASKWEISQPIKGVELYGDARVRFEDRSAKDPEGDQINLQRFRYAVRLGVRGDLFDDFYYGVRMDTGSNPRSPFVTFGTAASASSTGNYYQGPFGKSQAGVNIGQVYLGWHPEDWIDLTAGKMPNPLFTSSMVWSPNISPEGLAERFKYTVGHMDLFANFAQFIYQDENPDYESLPLTGLGFNTDNENIFQVAWQGGMTYHFTTNLTAKVAGTVYSYYGVRPLPSSVLNPTSPYYGYPYVGEGAYGGPNANAPYNVYGYSGFGTPGNGTSGGYASYYGFNYANNQVGLNNLLVVEIPFQLDYKFKGMDAHLFGDYAYNLDGKQRAKAAAAGYANYLTDLKNNFAITPESTSFSAQTHDVKAYQIGFGIGSDDVVYGPNQGLVYGTSSPRHAWEVRAYWQHVEQYSLDPNLLDLDFFNGVENMQGVYVAAAYAFTGNFIGTFRYGHASRINDQLGTGGSSGDIPQINPINSFDIYQVDLTVRF